MFGKKEEYVLHERKFKKRKKDDKPENKTEVSAAVDSTGAWEDGESTSGAVTVAELLDSEVDTTEREVMPAKMKKAPFYKKRKTMGGLLIGSSLVITMMISPVLSYLNQKETIGVVVATVEIKKGDVIQDSMIKSTTVSAGSVLAIQQLDMATVMGMYAKSDITTGEIVSSPKLSSELPFDNAYLYTLPEGKKAMSVSVDKLSANVSGKLEPGDVVSVYVAAEASENNVSLAAQQPPELTYVEVLSTTNIEGIDITTPPNKSELENPLPSTVVLAVDDAQAAIIAGSEIKGGVHLALVTRNIEAAAKLLEEQRLLNIKAIEDAIAKAETAASQQDADTPSNTAQGEVVTFAK